MAPTDPSSAAPTTAWSMGGGTASNNPDAHMAANLRPPRSPVARMIQSSRASWYFSTRRSPARTTHSNLAPDFESAGIIGVRDV